MNALARGFPNTDDSHDRFVELLTDQQALIAHHALAAWDGETLDAVNTNLEQARSILNEVAGTAGPVGYAALGVTAHHCAAQITSHLDGPYADLAICPGEIVWIIDTFIEACDCITH